MIAFLKRTLRRLATLGARIDRNEGDYVFYKSASLLDRFLVRLVWEYRMSSLGRAGRLFMVPEDRPGYVHDDSVMPFLLLANQLKLHPRKHILRIEHNHWRHDLDFDAVALTFPTPREKKLFVTELSRKNSYLEECRQTVAEHAITGLKYRAMNRALTARGL